MVNKKCVCNNGKKPINGRCKKDNHTNKCKGGTIVNGRCESNNGKILINGICKKNNKYRGGRLVNGSNGKSPVNGRCKKEKKCPPGFVKRGNGCVKKKCEGKNCKNTEHQNNGKIYSYIIND